MSPDVVVVGGGVVGASIAYQLAKRGASVTIIDRGEDPGPATPASAGLLVPVSEGARQGPLFELGRQSLRLFAALAADLRERTGVDVGYRMSGFVRVALNEAEVGRLRLRRSWDERAGISVAWVDRDRIQELEPALGDACQAALFSADAHQIDAPSLAEACRVAAVSLGATLQRGATVDSLLIEGARVAGVRCGLDETCAPEVVLANGAWAGAWSESLHCRLPIRPVRGQIVALRSDQLLPRNIIFSENGYLLRKHDGNIYVGATEEEAGFDSRPTLDGVAGLLQLALRIAPRLSEAVFDTVRAGLRPATPDRLPVIGRLPGWSGVSVATGHFRNGVLLAPITGEIVADLIGHGRPRISIDAFDPTRFLVRAA